MYVEISRKTINVSKSEDTNLTWYNSVLTVRSNKNLHLIDFTYNLHTLEKTIDLKECTITANYDCPLPEDFLTSYAARGLSNLELVEMITNSALWPHSNSLTQEMTTFVTFKWSPNNLINNNESILATVNSIGNVELFGPKRQIWASIMNFSQEMKKYLQNEYDNLTECSKEFIEIKKAVYSIETSTVCWAPELNADNSCYFVTIQKSGDILFWCLKQDYANIQTTFCGSIIRSNNFEINTVVWINVNKNTFLLVFCNEFGQVIINEFEIVNNKVKPLNEHMIWSYRDKMIVTHIDYMIKDGQLIVLFNKHRHLILQMYDKSLKLISEIAKNINDYRITAITKKHNDIYVCTVNMKVYKLECFRDNVLSVDLKLIDIKDSYPNHELHGIAFSSSSAIFALILLDRKLLYRKESLKYCIIFFCYESSLEGYANNVIDNPSKKLTDIWDSIEILRCKVIKAKKMPQLDYDKLLKDGECDVYMLKIYLIFLILYNNLGKMFSWNRTDELPEKSMVVIKDRILINQAVKVIKLIQESSEKEGKLNKWNNECFAGCKKFIFYYCKAYSKNPNDLIAEHILNLQSTDVVYTCQGCDNEIEEFSCKDGHLNIFCSLTFTIIDDDNYLVCKSCGATARAELMEQKPICVFCDLYLTNSSLPF